MVCFSHDGVRTVHHRDVQRHSMKNYSLVILNLVSFVMRCHRGWSCDYRMSLTATQQTACQSLNTLLQSCHGVPRPPETELKEEIVKEQDPHYYLDACHDLSEESDNEADEDEVPPTDNLFAQPSEASSSWNQIAENPVQTCILELLIALYCQLPTGTDDKFFSPILRFAVLFSLKRSGQWLPPSRITHILAVLLFCGREVMMALMHRRLVEDPRMRYSE